MSKYTVRVTYKDGSVFKKEWDSLIGARVNADKVRAASRQWAEVEIFSWRSNRVLVTWTAEVSFKAACIQDENAFIFINDFIDAWHESGEEEERSLHEYLGMTFSEYGRFLVSQKSLVFIVGEWVVEAAKLPCHVQRCAHLYDGETCYMCAHARERSEP